MATLAGVLDENGAESCQIRLKIWDFDPKSHEKETFIYSICNLKFYLPLCRFVCGICVR